MSLQQKIVRNVEVIAIAQNPIAKLAQIQHNMIDNVQTRDMGKR